MKNTVTGYWANIKVIIYARDLGTELQDAKKILFKLDVRVPQKMAIPQNS